MGCSSSDPAQPTLGEEYAKLNMVQPQFSDYENDFEKQCFFAINLLRHQPKSFITSVKEVAETHVLCKGKDTRDLISTLKSTPTLCAVTFSPDAIAAARKNNEAMVAKDEDVPTQGGNCDVYKSMDGNENAICEEFTMCQYMGDSAKELISLQLVLDWNREGELAKKSPLLNKDTKRVGISNKAHKKTKNLIQFLYVMEKANQMD